MIRVVLPAQLRILAGIEGEICCEPATETIAGVIDALEARYPVLRGTIRDQKSMARRPFIRFFACEEDLSHEASDLVLPEAVRRGREPLIVLGAIAGG